MPNNNIVTNLLKLEAHVTPNGKAAIWMISSVSVFSPAFHFHSFEQYIMLMSKLPLILTTIICLIEFPVKNHFRIYNLGGAK